MRALSAPDRPPLGPRRACRGAATTPSPSWRCGRSAPEAGGAPQPCRPANSAVADGLGRQRRREVVHPLSLVLRASVLLVLAGVAVLVVTVVIEGRLIDFCVLLTGPRLSSVCMWHEVLVLILLSVAGLAHASGLALSLLLAPLTCRVCFWGLL